ncbi:MAG: hypothetical protein ACE5HS_17825, partial [bacterium]
EGEEAGEGKEMPEGQKMMMPMTITVKRPNKIRFDMMNQEGAVYMTSCFDGTKGWSMQMGQQQEMMEEMAHDYEVMAMGWIDGFLNYQEKGFTLELLPDETIDDVTYLVLQSTDQYGNVTKNYIHPETHYIERAAGEMLNMQGQREPMYMTMTDYKMIEGCAMAQTVAQYKENGEMIWESKLTDAKFNTGVEDDQFKPQAMTMK